MIRPCRSTVASRSAAQSSAVTGKAVPKSRSGPRTSHRLTRRRRPNEAMLAALEVSPHAADDCDPPNVYTRANGINRAEAERMLAFWLERRRGIKNPKFGWRKTDFCVTPTGFGDYPSPDSAESGAYDVAPRQSAKI